MDLTVETCPHYLHGCAEDIPDGATLWKCAPPIRSRANREQLWQALRDGTIDCIATDHSPCPPHMKRLPELEGRTPEPGEEPGRFDEAWGGIPSLSTALPVIWSECVARNIALPQLAQWMSLTPARRAGLAEHVGSIEPGKHANFVAFDPDATFTVTPDRLHYRHAISPYMGETLHGEVRKTWLRGEPVYTFADSEATLAKASRGREYPVSCSLTR